MIQRLVIAAHNRRKRDVKDAAIGHQFHAILRAGKAQSAVSFIKNATEPQSYTKRKSSNFAAFIMASTGGVLTGKSE